MKKTKCLITGGAGFIGSHLVEALLKQKHEVTVIDDMSTGSIDNIKSFLDNPNFKLVIETILDESVMNDLIRLCDITFHLAAAVGVEKIIDDPVGSIETNIIGTENVLKMANRYRKKILLASTSEIYGKNDNVPFDEESDRVLGPPTKIRWSYSCSKAIDEYLALAYYKQKGLPIIICRFFNIIGPKQTGRYGMVVPRFIDQALKNVPITVYGNGKQTRTFLDVRDAVKGVIALAFSNNTIGQVFNIGGKGEISIIDLAKLVKQVVKSSSDIKYVTYEEAYEIGFEDMIRRVPNISKIQKAIAFKINYSLEDSIKNIVKGLK
jgi:UDP-glucose 4-epimerase